MFKKLVQFEAFYQLKQRALPMFALLFTFLGVFVGKQGFAPRGVNYNSVYQVYFHTSIFTLGCVFIIMFFAISAMLRDKQHHMESLIYSSSIKKRDYFWSRFLGTFIFSTLAFSPFILGYVFGNYSANFDPERMGEFQLLTYLQPWLYIVLPNIFICTSVIFCVSTLTKNSIATYASAVFIYMLYFVCSLFLNSPLLAQSVPASPEAMAIAAVLDPFGIAAFFEQTQFWTPFQKNTELLSFSGLFLMNRLFWVLISIGILLITYRVFSFRMITKRVKKEKKIIISKKLWKPYVPTITIHTVNTQLKAFLSLLKIELKSVFKSLPFIAILIMWIIIVFLELYATVKGGGEYESSIYPFTNKLIELILDPLTIFSILLITFYSAEIIWRERSMKFNLIIDATPIRNSIFFLSKFFALLLLPTILIFSGILMCIGFQVSMNYTNFEFGLYMSLFYYYGTQLVVFSMIAFFINSLVKSKYVGMGVFGLIAISCLKSNLLGLEHPLTSLGFMPRISYSNMNGFYGGKTLFGHLAIYWLAFGLLLILLSFKIWNRGVLRSFSIKIKKLVLHWTKNQKLSFLLLTILWVAAGSYIYYNNNILSEYTTQNVRLDFRENYERKFKKYENLERLFQVSRKTEVSMYPNEKKYTVKAAYVLKNLNESSLLEVFITERVPLKSVRIENAKLIAHDTIYGTYLYKFNQALPPNATVNYTFEFTKELAPYEEDRGIVSNGSYITHRDFEPILGYRSGLEITNRIEREKRRLPIKNVENHSDEHITFEEFKNEKIEFETIVSTTKEQIAISSGSLIKKWSANDRNYYHFKSKDRILPMIAYFSGNYKLKNINYKSIAIEQYYNKNHDFNIDEIENSTIETLDYCQENFGIYNFKEVRIAEIPSHWSFGGFAHPGVISMVEDRLYLQDVRNEDSFNLVSKRTVHEVAHQWWGHTLSAKPVAGGSLFVEGFAKYTEAVVLEKMYGKRAVYALVENARRRYFSGRSFASGAEPPVYKVLGQGYISYGKALTVMLALRDLVGETKVNQVLKTLTERYRNSNTLEVSTIEFLEEVYKITPIAYHNLINDWFKKVITYDVGIEDATYKELTDSTFEIRLTIKAKRFETVKTGEVRQISIDEPIRIGVFRNHPSVIKDNSSILYYELSEINKEFTEIKLIVKEKPAYISIDPYGTRSDENLVDNLIRL